MLSGDDSLWKSFPRALRTQEGARRYINAFWAPFQEFPTLSPQEIYTLWACSLLVIPPPIGRMVPQGGFLTDLTELNLLDWAALVQDMAAGLQVLPPRLSLDLGHQVALLQLLEAATGVGFCHHCCNPRPHCKCVGASQPAPPALWSQIVEQTPGYGLTSSSGGVTHPSTSMGGIPGKVVPPPGLTPPDYSIWSMHPLESSLPKGLPGSPWYRPPVGRASLLRAAIDQQAQALQTPVSRTPVLWAPVSQAPASQALVLRALQMVPPLCQPLPSSRGWPATPYQQAVQLLSKSMGLGVTFDSSANKHAATGRQDAAPRGRPSTQGWDDKSWPASLTRGAGERSSIQTTSKQTPHQGSEHSSGVPSNAPPASTLGSTSHQCSSSMRAPKDPLEHVAHHRSQGWRKDLEHVFKAYYKYNFASFKEAEWNKLRDKVLEHLLQHQDEWRSIRKMTPSSTCPIWRSSSMRPPE